LFMGDRIAVKGHIDQRFIQLSVNHPSILTKFEIIGAGGRIPHFTGSVQMISQVHVKLACTEDMENGHILPSVVAVESGRGSLIPLPCPLDNIWMLTILF